MYFHTIFADLLSFMFWIAQETEHTLHPLSCHSNLISQPEEKALGIHDLFLLRLILCFFLQLNYYANM